MVKDKRTTSLGRVKISLRELAAYKKRWRSQRELDESFAAWCRRKLAT